MPTKKTQTKPQKSSAKRQSTRSSHRSRTNAMPANRPRLSSIIFTTLLLLAVSAMGVLFYLHSKQPPTQRPTVLEDEKYYFTDSRYAGIRSKFVTRDTKREKVSIEYPITSNSKINRLIARAIDRADSDFRYASSSTITFERPMTETISYQVTHNNSVALSIIVNIKQDMHGAHPVALTLFWTFNKDSGEVISLDNLTEKSEEATKAIVTAAQRDVAQTIKQRQQPEVNLEEMITKEALANFTIADDGNALVWPIGQASLLPSVYGELTIKVPTATVAKYLQNPTAQKLGNFPKPPEPKPEPKPAPAAPAPTPTTGNKVIALTFDDGPGPYTAHLLDILDQYGAKATFFLIGSKVSGQASVVRSIHARGHQLGNHSWSHPELPKLSVNQIAGEIDRTNEAIKQAAGVKPTILRPPYGAANGVVLEQLRARGMSSILWSVDTRDWADRNSQIVCSRAVAGARPGAVILMHDIHQTSVNAVPCILSSLKQQGYSFVTIQRLH